MTQSAVFPTIDPSTVGWITEEQMIEVDRVMIEDLRIELLQMMENAGRNLARLVLDLYNPNEVAVAAGSGGNGGGGLVAARHLANAGVSVTVTTTRPAEELTGVPAHQLDILQRMGVAVVKAVPQVDVTIDAVIGYSLHGAPRGASVELIESINRNGSDSTRKVVSLDNPSGLDVSSGLAPGVAVNADATMTLCLPKVGLRNATQVGDLYLADISVPRSVTTRLGPSAPDFRMGSIAQLR